MDRVIYNYTVPLGRILKATGLEHHSYADDTQTCNTVVPCPRSDESEGIKALERGLELARSWAGYNGVTRLCIVRVGVMLKPSCLQYAPNRHSVIINYSVHRLL